MRWVVVIVLLACRSSNPGDSGDSPDAFTCSAAAVPGCVAGGLAGIVFDGASPWQLDGTMQMFGATSPYSSTIYLLRGPTACAFAVSSQPRATVSDDASVHVDDTSASQYVTAVYPHSSEHSWSLCVRESDGALAYHAHDFVSMPLVDQTIDGVLAPQ